MLQIRGRDANLPLGAASGFVTFQVAGASLARAPAHWPARAFASAKLSSRSNSLFVAEAPPRSNSPNSSAAHLRRCFWNARPKVLRISVGWVLMRSWALLFVALSVVACSSAPTDEGAKTPATPDTSVFDNCVAFATRLCADAETCCQTAYGDYSADGCLATFKREVCRPGADAVTAGKATFDEDAVEACLAAHAAAHVVCIPTWKQALELNKEIYSACRVLDGTAEPGRGCAIAATCKHPEGTATVACVKNVCKVIEILPEGAECEFPKGDVSVCDDGLACDAPGEGVAGHCVKAVATGEACDASVLEGTDCGLGSFCDPDRAVCQVAANLGGNGCSQSNECVSFDCNRLANECAPAPAVLSRDTCLGAPLSP